MSFKIKKYLSFRKRDRIGILALLSIVFLLIIIDISIPFLVKEERAFDYTAFTKEIDSFLLAIKPVETEYVSKLDSYIIARYDTLNLFPFDPNTTTDQQWLNLGLTDKQISTINNYKEKGGRFVIKDDFRKIYGIRTKQYQILEPFILLPDEEPEKSNYDNKQDNDEKPKKEPVLFEFDPNTATDEDYEKLGFTSNQIKVINNYRSKGGKFYKKEDFKKIYVVSEEQYKLCEPYIVIKTMTEEKPISIVFQPVDINTADTTMFKTLPGIGSVIASRIVKYRNSLGGFYSIEQISEVYGIKKETFDNIKPYLVIGNQSVKKININFSEYNDLVKHPYIDSEIANSILDFRRKNGFYTSVNQLINNGLVNEQTFEKLKIYLTVE